MCSSGGGGGGQPPLPLPPPPPLCLTTSVPPPPPQPPLHLGQPHHLLPPPPPPLLPPAAPDPHLVEAILAELKSQGVFDQFRKECIADVDTKPAYQNLRQRVEGSVAGFLNLQNWSPDLNKNQLRERLRKHILDSNFLDQGVERIVDQVVNPKISSVFIPQVEEIFYKYLGIEKPDRTNNNNSNQASDIKLEISSDNLLPNDLESVSPESVKSFEHKSAESILENLKSPSNITTVNQYKVTNQEDKLSFHSEDSANSNDEEFESPAFEPLEGNLREEGCSKDSHLSGISDLTSHDSNISSNANDTKIRTDIIERPDTELSQVSSDSNLSIDIATQADKVPKPQIDFKNTFSNVKHDENNSNFYGEKMDVSPTIGTNTFNKYDNDGNSSDARQCYEESCVQEVMDVKSTNIDSVDESYRKNSAIDTEDVEMAKSTSSNEATGLTVQHHRDSIESKTSTESVKVLGSAEMSLDSNESNSVFVHNIKTESESEKEVNSFENKINPVGSQILTENSDGSKNGSMKDTIVTDVPESSGVAKVKDSESKSGTSKYKDSERYSSSSSVKDKDKKDDSRHSRNSHSRHSTGRHDSERKHSSSHDKKDHNTSKSSRDSRSDKDYSDHKSRDRHGKSSSNSESKKDKHGSSSYKSSHRSSRHSDDGSRSKHSSNSEKNNSEKHSSESKDNKYKTKDAKNDVKSDGSKEKSGSSESASHSKSSDRHSNHHNNHRDKSSSRHSHTDKTFKSNSSNSSEDKKNDDKKSKKSGKEDNCSSSSKNNRTRRSTDRDSNDGSGGSTKGSNNPKSSSANNGSTAQKSKSSNSAGDNNSNSNYSGQSDNLKTDSVNITAGRYIKSEFNMFEFGSMNAIKRHNLNERANNSPKSSDTNSPKIPDSPDITSPMSPIKMIEKSNLIKSPEIPNKKPVIHIDSQLKPLKMNEINLIENIQCIPILKKPKCASNIKEARRVIKIRKEIDKIEQKRKQEALQLLEKQHNIPRNSSQVYSSASGPEVELACMKIDYQQTTPVVKVHKLGVGPHFTHFDNEIDNSLITDIALLKNSILKLERECEDFELAKRRSLNIKLQKSAVKNSATNGFVKKSVRVNIQRIDNAISCSKMLSSTNTVLINNKINRKRPDEVQDDSFSEQVNSNSFDLTYNMTDIDYYEKMHSVFTEKSEKDILQIILGDEESFDTTTVSFANDSSVEPLHENTGKIKERSGCAPVQDEHINKSQRINRKRASTSSYSNEMNFENKNKLINNNNNELICSDKRRKVDKKVPLAEKDPTEHNNINYQDVTRNSEYSEGVKNVPLKLKIEIHKGAESKDDVSINDNGLTKNNKLLKEK